MKTQCNKHLFAFQAQNLREVVAKFDGGTISTDGGALLLREAEHLTGSDRNSEWRDVFSSKRRILAI